MTTIREAAQGVAEVIATLSDELQQVGRIAQLVKTGFRPSDLVALNAALEATRAGAVGRSFSVGAAEKRTWVAKVAWSFKTHRPNRRARAGLGRPGAAECRGDPLTESSAHSPERRSRWGWASMLPRHRAIREAAAGVGAAAAQHFSLIGVEQGLQLRDIQRELLLLHSWPPFER